MARNDVTAERLAERAAQYGTGTGDGSKVTAIQFRATCGKCGARRIDQQLGLEATPDEYLATMVAVFREVRRVLRDDGTCWVNMGDSYAANRTQQVVDNKHKFVGNDVAMHVPTGLKPKDLLMMPARLALALQADGWWLRSDIIWAKPNPMPESVTDRPTSAHEHVFLLTKRSRYFYDGDAVREPHQDANVVNGAYTNPKAIHRDPDNVPPNQGWTGSSNGFATRHRDYNPSGRNLRNVWQIATAPFPAAHFATFPPELAERCIKAGTSERGCCAACGKPWVRMVQRSVSYTSGSGRAGNVPEGKHAGSEQAISGSYDIRLGPSVSSTTTGWSPGCTCLASHDGETKPCTVLDPFAGAGTVGLVADRLQRNAVLIELNPAYCAMLRDRIANDAPMFADINDAPVPEPPEDERMADLFAGDEYQRPLPPAHTAFRSGAAYLNQRGPVSNGEAASYAAPPSSQPTSSPARNATTISTPTSTSGSSAPSHALACSLL